MIYSATVLAQGRGHVVITSDWDTGRLPWRRTDQLVVRRLDTRNELIEETTIKRVEGEAVRDCKARAIAAVRMLGYWPELRREIAKERRTSGVIGHRNLSGDVSDRAVMERATKSGIILPGAP